MDNTYYFGQGRMVAYNRFPEDDNGAVKKKGVLYRMLYGLHKLCGISNFQIYNKSILRYGRDT